MVTRLWRWKGKWNFMVTEIDNHHFIMGLNFMRQMMFQCYIEHPITYQGNVNLSSVGLAAIQGVETWTWGPSGHEDISKHKQLVDIT